MKKPDVSLTQPHVGWDKKNALVGLIILIVLIGVGIGWYATHHKKSAPMPTVPQYSGQQLADELNKKYVSNDYIGAINLLKGQKTINEPETQQFLATAYVQAGQYQEALKVYAGLDKSGKLSGENTAGAAEVAEKAHDYALAATYYQKAAERVQNDPLVGNQDTALLYQQKAEEMRGKQ